MKRNFKRQRERKIARERIERLFELARINLNTHPERSRRYVQLARKIGMRYNVRLRKEQKRSFCKKCNQLLIPGKTSLVRLDSKKKLKIIKCLNCGNIYKYPYLKRRVNRK